MSRIIQQTISICLLVLVTAPVMQAQVRNLSGQDSTIFISNSLFIPGYGYPSGDQNWDVILTDLNRDGYPDAVSASRGTSPLQVHLNDGKGHLAAPIAYAAVPNLRSLCALDANQDGAPDIAAVSLTGKLCLLLNNGRGQLTVAQAFSAAGMAQHVISADLNGDRAPDLVVPAVSDDVMQLYLNDGRGKFAPPVLLRTGHEPRSAAAGDLNGDGLPDLVAGCDDGYLYLFINQGRGTWQKPVPLPSTPATWGLALADLDANGHADIAAASYQDKRLFVHYNRGGAVFDSHEELLSGDHNFDLAARDMDLDGDLDLITCSSVDHALSLHLNDGQGKLGLRNKEISGQWNAGLDIADMDLDGDPDIVTASVDDHQLTVHRNKTADERPSAPPPPACLSGTLVDDASGNRISPATLSLQSLQGEPVEAGAADKEGGFRLCPPGGRSYLLIVRTAGYPVYQDTLYMPRRDSVAEIRLRRPTEAFVYGVVADRQAKKPLPGAPVHILRADGSVLARLTTDARGHYRQRVPFGLNYQLSATHTGYDTAISFINIGPEHVAKGAKVDLWLGQEAQTGCVSGTVRHIKTRQPIPGAVLTFADTVTGEQQTFRADTRGQYQACLPPGAWRVHSGAAGYFFARTRLDIPAGQITLIHDVDLTPLEKDAVMILRNIYFDVDKATLREESVAELDRLLEVMRQNPSLVVEIAGHTDSDASETHNQTLSQHRAEAVVDYLLAAGIERPRMVAAGYGESRPVAPNDTPTNKQLNRRTECKVLAF